MPAISFQSISKSYPSPRGPQAGTFLALDDVSLAVEEGEFFGLLGPNGAGKTTLITILAGLAKASAGRVSVMGHDVQTDFAAARRALGVVPQELVFDPFFNVREALLFQSGYFGVRHNEAWVDELLDSLGLADKANVNMRALSGGMKRRVLVAQALVHRPPVIVLDEPTAGVDVALRQGLWKFIRRLNRDGHTIILTTHYLEEAEALCGRLALMRAGEICALEKTDTLIRQFAKHRLIVRLAEGDVLPEALAAMAVVMPEADRSWQWTLEALSDIESVLAALRESGCRLEDMSISPPDLETAFLSFMNDAPEASA